MTRSQTHSDLSPLTPLPPGAVRELEVVTDKIRRLDSERIELIFGVYQSGLWRASYLSFPEWLEHGCGYKATTCRELVQAIQVRLLGIPVPNASVAAKLSGLDPDAMRKVLTKAADPLSGMGGVTANSVERARRDYEGSPDMPEDPGAADDRDSLALLAPGIPLVEALESALRSAVKAAKSCAGSEAARHLDIHEITQLLTTLASRVSSMTPERKCVRMPPHVQSCVCRGRGWLTRADTVRLRDGDL